MNILDAAEKFGLTMKKVGTTKLRGVEYAGACPVCSGTDRFRIAPDNGDTGGTYFCRQCGIKGDCIKFLREYLAYSFKDAAAAVGLALHGGKSWTPAPTLQQHKPAAPYAGGDYAYPPEAWSVKAEAFVQHLRKSQENINRAVEYLLTRGMNRDTAEQFGMVYNPQQYFRPMSSWGLPEVEKEDGSSAKLYISAGLVIPHSVEGRIVRVLVRRGKPQDPPYLPINGSTVEPMMLRSNPRCLLVVETYLDGMLCHQLAGDLVSVMAIGAASIRPGVNHIDTVREFPLILVALDNDANGAGDKASAWWLEQFPQAKRFKPAAGKDPGEHPTLVRQWISSRVPWGCSADFLKKKEEGEGVNKSMVGAGSSRPTIPWKCRGCWAQLPDDETMCCKTGDVLPIADLHTACEYQ